MYTPQHADTGTELDESEAIDWLAGQLATTQNAIMGLCVAMMMHIVGTYLLLRRLKRG